MVVSALARSLPGWHGHHWSCGASALVGRLNRRHRAAPFCSASDATEDGWQLGQSWRDALANELSEPYFTELRSFVEGERTTGAVLPSREDQFAAFRACDFDDVRVVILGQDPYPTPGNAHGLAFSVLPHVRPLPGSLRNIYLELNDDLGIAPAEHGCLSAWSGQGVLLLNTVLTVRSGEAGSHARRGWERFTTAIIAALAERNEGMVFMLWGKAAQDKGRLIDPASHLILQAAHPSPLSARRGFFGCAHFSRANEYLSGRGRQSIEWAVGQPPIEYLKPIPEVPATPPSTPPAPPIKTAPAAQASATLPTTRLSRAAAEKVIAAARSKRSEPLKLPPRLSPTAITAFRECPQLFLFRQLWKLPEPPTLPLVKGTLVHATLENIFKLPAAERAAKLHDTLRDEWRVGREKPENAQLFASRDEERAWGLQCLELLDNYLAFEDPASLPAGEPLAHEAWLSADLQGPVSEDSVRLVGKVDRLDVSTEGDGVVIVDYKTGKPPNLKYSKETNERIRTAAFFQLRCYALLLARGALPPELDTSRAPARAQKLRLLYLGTERGGDAVATAVEEELPDDELAYGKMLDATQAEVTDVWAEIKALVEKNDPNAFCNCTRSFCSCHDLRPLAFFPGLE